MSENIPGNAPEERNDAVSDSAIFDQRLEKAREFAAAGIAPWGQRFDGSELVSTLRAGYDPAACVGEDGNPLPDAAVVRAAGRMMSMRLMGKSIFADLQDSSGRMQLFISRSELGDEAFAFVKKLDVGDIIGVDGRLFTTRTGELTIRVNKLTLLSKSLRPLPEKFHGLTDVEQRYRRRYLDLIMNPESRRILQLRFKILREIRSFMESRGFTEVETPMLQAIAGGASANPFKTWYEALSCPMYMRIAPELDLKRLLVGGFEKVFELNRNFRNEGVSRRHNPEFTMMEVYQAYGDCRTMMELIESLVTTVAMKCVGTLDIDHGNGKIIHLAPPWRRVTYRELLEERAGKDWFQLSKEEKIARAKNDFGIEIDPAEPDFEVTNTVYEKMIEGTLIQPTFVLNMPAELVPLAKANSDDPSTVDVFELEINGIEVAPAYSELNDPVEQRRRFREQFERTRQEGDELADKVDEDFLQALEYGMPPAGGMGIGIDRLVIMLTGAESIRDVLLFPQMRIKK